MHVPRPPLIPPPKPPQLPGVPSSAPSSAAEAVLLGPKDIHQHNSGRAPGVHCPLLGRPLDGVGVYLGVPQVSAVSEAAPVPDTVADIQITLQMMLQVVVLLTASTKHGTAMDTTIDRTVEQRSNYCSLTPIECGVCQKAVVRTLHGGFAIDVRIPSSV